MQALVRERAGQERAAWPQERGNNQGWAADASSAGLGLEVGWLHGDPHVWEGCAATWAASAGLSSCLARTVTAKASWKADGSCRQLQCNLPTERSQMDPFLPLLS